jgi:hemoglobin-like flavoprotein
VEGRSHVGFEILPYNFPAVTEINHGTLSQVLAEIQTRNVMSTSKKKYSLSQILSNYISSIQYYRAE